MDMDTPTTAPVLVELVGIEAVTGMGKVTHLATVDIEVAGVAWQLQGVRIIKQAGGLIVEAPVWRHPRTGLHVPAVVLPAALTNAIVALLGEELQGSRYRAA